MKKWILVLIVPAMIVAGCGGSDDGGSGDAGSGSSGSGSSAAAIELFSDNCAGCHTLSEADATGPLGPELDGAGLSTEAVQDQIENGGGSMPAFKDKLSPEEINQLAEFVSGASQS